MQDELKLRLILNGRYGIGLTPPSDFGYVDMEPVYTSYLNEYGKSLVLVFWKGEEPMTELRLAGVSAGQRALTLNLMQHQLR